MECGQSYDVIFLDIQIPNEMSGMEIAKRIRVTNEYVQIVFVTNYVKYSCEGYHVNALRFLCKPVHQFQIDECMDIVYEQVRIVNENRLVINDHKEKLVMMYKDIFYIESRGHILVIHRTLSKEPLCIRMTLTQMHGLLPHELFVKCHRSFILNILYVRRITRETVTLAGGQEIVVGKKHRDTLFAAFDRYYQGILI